MVLLGDLLKGNPLTALAIGVGAVLLAPTIGSLLRPAAKAVIKGGILAYQGLAEFGETASDLVAEARADMEQQDEIETASSPPAERNPRPARSSKNGGSVQPSAAP